MKRFQDLKVGTRIAVASALVAVCGALLLAASLVGQSQTIGAITDIQAAEARAGMLQAARLQMADLANAQALYELDVERGVKGATTEASPSRQSFLYALGEFQKTVQQMKATDLAGSPRGAALLSSIQEGLDRYVRTDAAIFAKYQGGKEAAAARLGSEATQTARTIENDLMQLTDLVGQQGSEAVTRADLAHSKALYRSWVAVVVGICLGIAFIALVTRSVTRPLGRAVVLLDRVAEGDLTDHLEVQSRDEIGQMARALNASVDSTAAVVHSIRDGAAGVAASSDELSATAAQMRASADETSAQVSAISAAAEQVSHTVQVVASSAEEMSSSVREIASSANEAAAVAAGAVGLAGNADRTVTTLGVSSAQIGAVVKVITSIAEQTNLLALNATIEAARAGDAGKGFAVVANEVKDLAKETAKATEEIASTIATIQTDTKNAVDAIHEITEVIEKISDIQTTIASAVEEQSVTTNEISRNAGENAAAAKEIAESIAGVAQAAHDTSAGASSTQTAAQHLASLADDLMTVVSRFKVDGDEDREIKRYVPLSLDGSEAGGNGSAHGVQPERIEGTEQARTGGGS